MNIVNWFRSRMGHGYSNWQVVPDNTLAEIACYLEPGERFNASLVCKHWHRVISSATLWYDRSFYLNGTHLDQMAINFAARYGHLLQTLRLNFIISLDSREIEVMEDNFYTFLSKLKNRHTNLISLKLGGSLGVDLGSSEIFFNGSDLGHDLASFLKSQKSLEVFDLSAVSLNIPASVLISILSSLNKSRLRKLTLQKFYTLPDRVYSYNAFLDLMAKYTNLQSLKVRHDFINNDVLLNVATASKEKWKKLEVSYDKFDSLDHFISTSAWLEALCLSPNLEVGYIIDAGWKDICGLANFLLQEKMPLKDLLLNLELKKPQKEAEEQFDFAAFISQLEGSLVKFFGTLDRAQVNLPGDYQTTFESISTSVFHNPNLASLDIAIQCDKSEYELQNICRSIIDSPTAFENLNLYLSPVTDRLLRQTESVLKSFFQTIRSRGTQCQFYPMGIFNQDSYNQLINTM